MEKSKNWEDYTPEDNEALYTEDFDLMKELGLKPAEEEQTSAGFVTVEQLEQQQLLQLGFSTNLLEKPNTRTSEEEIVWLKQQVLREQQLRQKAEDELGMTLVRLRLEMASKVSDTQPREDRLLKELEGLKMLRVREREEYSAALKVNNEEIHRLQQDKELVTKQHQVSQRLLKEANQLVQTHEAELDKQSRETHEVHTELNCMKQEKRSLLERSERLQSQIDSVKKALAKQVAEAKDLADKVRKESLQKFKEWETEKQALFKEKQDLHSTLLQKEAENTSLLQKNTQLELALTNLRREMSKIAKTSDEQKEKLKDETQQKILMDQKIQDQDKLVQDLKKKIEVSTKRESQTNQLFNHVQDKLHKQEVLNENLQKSLNRLEQEVQQEKKERAEVEEERHLLQEKSSALQQDLRKAEEERHLVQEKSSALEQDLRKAEEECHLLERMNGLLEEELVKKERKWYRKLLCC
ncbi:hypothetical protein WMY93_019694 [Mugilogobius chulae]|uniref:Uncharacterized protein n=1 Tax=Mugilogobius chulae TaxID=88201 RepID=A0AAW0NRW2_9GOBI